MPYNPKRPKGAGVTVDFHLHEQLKQEASAEGRILRDKTNEALACYLALPKEARQALIEAYRNNQQVLATVEHRTAEVDRPLKAAKPRSRAKAA